MAWLHDIIPSNFSSRFPDPGFRDYVLRKAAFENRPWKTYKFDYFETKLLVEIPTIKKLDNFNEYQYMIYCISITRPHGTYKLVL